jgi:hypothetical protein
MRYPHTVPIFAPRILHHRLLRSTPQLPIHRIHPHQVHRARAPIPVREFGMEGVDQAFD